MSVNKGTDGTFKVGRLVIKQNVLFLSGSGAPTNGASGTGAGIAGPGSLYVDTDNGAGNHYRNTNTQASPTWTLTT